MCHRYVMAQKTDKTSPETIRAWTRLVRAEQICMNAVEAALKAAGLPALAWYDVLLELRRAGPDGMRQIALEDELLMAQYNLSRLVSRIENAGLLSRIPDPEDGRGHRLVLTKAGADMLGRMWPVYDAALAVTLGDRLDPDEARMLGDLLQRLLQTRSP